MELPELVGLEATVESRVTPEMTAAHVGSGGVDVLSTPTMILMFEQAARDAVQPQLPEGFTTVGVRVDVEHVAATALYETVTVRAAVVSSDGRTIDFTLEAWDRFGRIGSGTHRRCIVNLDRFMKRLAERCGLDLKKGP
jgi:fluoroacetyl-CoA thioesterase